MSKLTIHNWDKWQSYRKDRGQPPWIKIHRECMRHIGWVSLSDAQRGQLVAIWLLAADHNGVIPASPSVIKKLCHLDSEPDLNLFIEHGFIDAPQSDVIVASSVRQVDSPEKRREETDTETDKKKTDAAFALPDWICKEHWDIWIKARKKMTPEQKQMQVNKLKAWKDEGLDFAGALANAAANGTQGLFLPDSRKRIIPRQDSFDTKDYGQGVTPL